MANQFGVTPPELRGVSADLHDVSSRMKELVSTLRAQLAGEGAPWGQFANGPNGISGQLAWVNGSVDAETNVLDYYSNKLKQAADTFAQSDGG